MNIVWMIGAIGFAALVPALAGLFIAQFFNRLALMPFMIGVLVEAICAILTGMYWIAGLLVLSFIASIGYAITTYEPEPVDESADTVEILPWLANSNAYQAALSVRDNPHSQTGKHRQKYIRHRGPEQVRRMI